MTNASRFSGFSLIEILVVIVIIALAAGVGVANFRDFGRRQDVSNYSRTLMADLRAVHSDASAGRRVTGCNGTFTGYAVDFNASPVSGGAKSTTYNVSAVCASSSFVTKTVSLPQNLYLSINRTPTGGKVRLLFKALEQGTDVPIGTPLNLTITSAALSGVTQQVSVLATGEIQ